MPLTWLNAPCTDPIGRMCRTADGRVLRALFPARAADGLAVLQAPVVRSLMDERRVARMRPTSERIDGYGAVIESEQAPFDVPCSRFTLGALRQAALGWLEITRRLLPAELCLTDAHFGNFMLFGANEPRWVDLGSIRHAAVLPLERPFRAFALFWEGLAAPLLLLARDRSAARLARLAIADQPLQGPRFADDEAPLSVAALVEEERRALLAACETASPEEALSLAASFIAQRVPPIAAHPDGAGRLDAKLVAHVAGVLERFGCTSVACFGAQGYFAAAGVFAGRDVLVVDPSPAALADVEGALQGATSARNVALCQEHPLNRFFRREALRADAAFAVDPVRSLAHASDAELANIGGVLDEAAARGVVVVCPHGQLAATRHMLEQRFGAVELEHFGWRLGGWDVLVCAKH